MADNQPLIAIDGPIRLGDLAHTWRDSQQIRWNDRENFRPMATGIRLLDVYARLRHPFLGIVIGKPKKGKTAFKQSVALGLAEKQKMVVLWHAYEMPLYDMIQRSIANIARVDSNRFDDFKADTFEWDQADEAIDRLDTLDFYIVEGHHKLDDALADLRWIRSNFPGRKILWVNDYPLLMEGLRGESIREQQTHIASVMRKLTKRQNGGALSPETLLGIDKDNTAISILTSAQIPLSLKRSDGRVDLHSAAESGAWGNNVDVWFCINDVPDERKGLIPNAVEVDIGSRRGAGGTATLVFNGAQSRYEDAADPEEVNPIG